MRNPRTKCSIVVSGSNIPQWMINSKEGSSIRIIRPPDLSSKKKLVAYAICSVFHVHEHLPIIRSRVNRTYKLSLQMKADTIRSSSAHFTHSDVQLGQAVSEHLWLLYLSCEKYFDEEWQLKYSQNQFSFVSNGSPTLEVKRVLCLHSSYRGMG